MWVKHGVRGWYIGPAIEHYRCYCVYIPHKRAEGTADTVEFFLAHTKVYGILSAYVSQHTAKHIILVLVKLAPAAPFALIVDRTLAALRDLANIFQHTLKVDEQRAKSNTVMATQPAATNIELMPAPRVA